MFLLSRMVDTVRLPPHQFGGDFTLSLERALNDKFANKVVCGVGLCIAVYDFEEVHKSFLLPNDGASHTKVAFRTVVFRPFVDELLVGTIRSSSAAGVTLSVGVFDEIVVPSDKLPSPAAFEDGAWYWRYPNDPDDSDEQAEEQAPVKLFLDVGKVVRFRVVEERFHDTVPVSAAGGSGTQPKGEPLAQTGDAADTSGVQPPYQIIATMGEQGLGCIDWWAPADDGSEQQQEQAGDEQMDQEQQQDGQGAAS